MLVAGGGRGIGTAIAMVLVEEGADVAIASRTQTELETTAGEIECALKRKVASVVFDVTDREQVDKGISQAAEILDGLHILVNSASLPAGSPSAVGPINTVDEAALLKDFDVKYNGALRCARASIPFMKKARWGRIINISGGNGRKAGNLSGGARNVSLVHLTKTLSNELGKYGITVNCIHPGVTRTERTKRVLEHRSKLEHIKPEEIERQDFLPGSALGNAICRMIDAQEIGFLAAYLASDKSWAVTGEVIAAGGGNGDYVYY